MGFIIGNMENDLIDMLVKMQEEAGLTNAEFAAQYDITGNWWSQLRNRQSLPSRGLLGMILRKHPYNPSIQAAVIKYLVELRET